MMQAHLTPQGQPHPPNQQQTQPQHPPPPPSGQDFQLSSVLHYLQSEWRRYEKDRNEWEIERAEMRARIALLEGERRSFEHVKLDFMRRTKMLEYALRVERSVSCLQIQHLAHRQVQCETTFSALGSSIIKRAAFEGGWW